MQRLLAVVLVAACSSHGNGNADAAGGDDGGGGDVAVDVPNVVGTVHVQVVDPAGANLANNHVVFINTDGAVTDVMTDAAGAAQGDVLPGASVTVMHPTASGFQLATIQAIEPGDQLVVGTQIASAAAAGDFTLTWPIDNAGNVGGYYIYHPCGNTPVAGKTTVSRTLAKQCVGGTKAGFACTVPGDCTGGGTCTPVLREGCVTPAMDFVVVAVDSTGTTPLAYTEQSGIAFTAGGAATITDTWHAIPQLAATYTNPTGVATIQLDTFVPDLKGTHATVAMAAAPTTNLVVARPNAATATLQTTITSAAAAEQVITQVVDGTALAYPLDVGASELPWLGTPVLDTTTHALAVAVDGTQPVDLFATRVFYTRGNCNTAPVEYNWWVFGPTPGDVTLPALGAAIGDIYPLTFQQGGCTQNIPTYAYGCQSDVINGYRPARTNAFDSLDTCMQSTNPTARRMPGAFNRLSRSD